MFNEMESASGGEPEVKKINWTRMIITVVIVLVTAAAFGGSVWYFMDQQVKKAEDSKNKEVQELQKQIKDLNKKESTVTTTGIDETANWKTYVNSVYKYSIKYPSEWQVKEYGSGIRTEANPACIAKTAAEFPPPQTDAPCPIFISNQPDTDNDTTTGVTRETLTIAGKTVTKVTIPANTLRRMSNWPEVEYIFPYYNSYIFIVNKNNYELPVFEKIVKSISFY